MPLDIVLIIRPRTGDESWMPELREEVSRLRRSGHRVRPRLTYEAGDASRFASAAANARCDLVLAAGGDGTINEVVNGLVRCRWQPRLGVIPLGTANDFAAGLGIPDTVSAAVDAAVAGRPVAADVGRLNDRYFINVSTGGFGAEATEQAPAQAKRKLGAWAYVISGARRFVGLRPTRARFEAEGKVLHEGPFLVFAVGNARQTGGGTMLTPRARYGDGKLDVVIVPGMSRLDFLALMPDLRAGTHLESPDVLYVQTSELRIRAEETISVNADGEPLRGRAFRYGLASRPLSVMLP